MQTSHQGQGAAKARVGVQKQSSEVVQLKGCKAPAVTSSRDPELYETAGLLTEEMVKTRKSITNPQGPNSQVKQVRISSPASRGCKAYQDQGTGGQCEHCFKWDSQSNCEEAGEDKGGWQGNLTA